MYTLRKTTEDAIEELQRRAADIRRPRPPEWTEEEANERIAAALEKLASTLQTALDTLK